MVLMQRFSRDCSSGVGTGDHFIAGVGVGAARYDTRMFRTSRAVPGVAVLVFCCASVWSQTQSVTVAKVVEFVRNSIGQISDKKVADEVRHFRMSERLDAKTVENLRRSGAGPQTVEALTKLVEASAGLDAPAKGQGH